MKQVYIVRGLGLGDDENTFENMCAFANLAEAEEFVEEVKREDADEGYVGAYTIETLKLVA